ncbi:MAG TPA: metalloregulator ArsR/SmtB family transcription factor [Thermoanaerobaculia bacterium]|nr:metalloregulator ArsR/SmtB family transcription factor [Thermoanaerobaculia bacterium]
MSANLALVAAPRRREILRLVWDRERGAGEIAAAMPDVTFGAVSQHLALLSRAGLVQCRREGRRRYYAARKGELEPLREWLESSWDDALARLKTKAEIEAARRGPRQGRRRRKK